MTERRTNVWPHVRWAGSFVLAVIEAVGVVILLLLVSVVALIVRYGYTTHEWVTELWLPEARLLIRDRWGKITERWKVET